METSSPSLASSPTLSAVIAEDRRREARRQRQGGGLLPYLVPACGRPAGQIGGRPLHSELMIKLHRWGATFLPKGGGAVARELEAPRRAPSPPPRPRPSIAPAAATFLPKGSGAVVRELEARRRAPSPSPGPRPSIAPAAAAAEAEVMRRHEAPAVSVPARRPLREREEPAAGSKAIAQADMSAGESAGSSDRATPVATFAGGGEGTWLKVSPRTAAVRSPSVQTDTSNESPRSLGDSTALAEAADDKYVWADKYRPNVLNEFICNKTVAAELYQLVITRPHCKRCFELACSFVSEQLLG